MNAKLNLMMDAIQAFTKENGFPPSYLFAHPSDMGGHQQLLLENVLVRPDVNAKPGYPMPFYGQGVRPMSVDCADAPDPKELIRSLTAERDDYKAKFEAEKKWNVKRCADFAAELSRFTADAQRQDNKWNELVEFWQKKAQATEHLSDTCGALKTENTELFAENARLRRQLEKLERAKGRK